MDKFDKADVLGRVKVIMALHALNLDWSITSKPTKDNDDLELNTGQKLILIECKHIHSPSTKYPNTLISAHKIERLEAIKKPYLVAFSWDDDIVRLYDMHKLLLNGDAYPRYINMTKTTYGNDTIALPEKKIFFPTNSYIKEINLTTAYAL